MPIKLKEIKTDDEVWIRYKKVGVKVYKVKWTNERLKKFKSKELLNFKI